MGFQHESPLTSQPRQISRSLKSKTTLAVPFRASDNQEFKTLFLFFTFVFGFSSVQSLSRGSSLRPHELCSMLNKILMLQIMRSEITKYIWWVGIQSTASWETLSLFVPVNHQMSRNCYFSEWNAQDSGGQTTDLSCSCWLMQLGQPVNIISNDNLCHLIQLSGNL